MLICVSATKKITTGGDLPEGILIGDLALDEYLVDEDGNYLMGF